HALVLRRVVDGRKGPGPGGNAQVAEQAIWTQAREPHAVEGRKVSGPKGKRLDLGTCRIAAEIVEDVLPVLVEVPRWLAHCRLPRGEVPSEELVDHRLVLVAPGLVAVAVVVVEPLVGGADPVEQGVARLRRADIVLLPAVHDD